MKSLKVLALTSMMFSFPVFASVYQCNIGVGWYTDAAGQNWEFKNLSSGTVDTAGEGVFFPIENSNLQFGCGGNTAGTSAKTLVPTSADNSDFVCVLAPSINVLPVGMAVTKIGAPIMLGVQVADETLPTKSKTLFAICSPQAK